MASAVAFEKTCSFHAKSDDRSVLSANEGKDKEERCCREDKCKLVGFDSLPGHMKDNEFILDYYRCEWPLKETILSIFSIHNETLNVWTHLIGFFIFLLLTISAVKMAPLVAPATADQYTVQPEVNDTISSNILGLGYMVYLPSATEMLPSLSIWESLTQANQNASAPPVNPAASNLGDDVIEMLATPESQLITRWPFYAFLFGAMFCLFTSSSCHLLSCHSEHCAYTMLRLDYTGISTLIVTSFYPLVYYTFMCDPFFCNLYLSFITLFGIATVLVSLVPVFQTPEFRTVRALLFACMAVSGLVPILHKMVAFGDRPEAIISTGYEMVMGLFYGLGVLAYATRVPERWMPGKFDLVGHSHQLFHVLVIAGAYTHYLGGLVYLQWRDTEGCY